MRSVTESLHEPPLPARRRTSWLAALEGGLGTADLRTGNARQSNISDGKSHNTKTSLLQAGMLPQISAMGLGTEACKGQ